MGFSLKKALRVKVDKNTGRNLVKNYTGVATGPVGSALGYTNLAGMAYDAVTGAKLGPDGNPMSGQIDTSAEARYEKLMADQRAKNATANESYTQQLKDAAEGKGPSLATALLKSNSNRSLAQTLSAAQTAGASPLQTRNMFQLRGQQSRDLAEQGAQARIQEQDTARTQLGNQLANQATSARQDITSGYDMATGAANVQRTADSERLRAQQDRDAANRARNQQLLAAGIAAAGTALSDENAKVAPKADKKSSKMGDAMAAFGKTLMPKADEDPLMAGAKSLGKSIYDSRKKKKGAALSDERSKLPPAKKEVNSFMDELEALQYEYKDPSAPGAAEGTRVGITAQDLEKSSLGKTLVKNSAGGKMVDTVQGFGTVLAATAELNRRLKKLEGKK